MNAMNGIAKQPPMRPAPSAAANSSIGTGRRGNGGKSYAVRGAEGKTALLNEQMAGFPPPVLVANPLPSVLYKYAPPCRERIEQVILHRKIYFSDPRAFNDPFDCRCAPDLSTPDKEEAWVGHIAKAFNEDAAKIRGLRKQYPNMFKTAAVAAIHALVLRADIGVCCFAKKPDSVPMWAHYARNHEGVCFEISPFRDEETKFYSAFDVVSTNDLRLWPFHIMGDVVYGKEYTTVKPNEKLDGLKLLFRKSDVWKYEEEWRAVISKIPKPGFDGPGLYPLGKHRLSAVILGYRIKSDLQDAVIKMAKRESIPVRTAWPKFSEYGMNIRPYDEVEAAFKTHLVAQHRL